MDNTIFLELSVVIVSATVVSLVMRLLRQPLILGYILTGIVIGPAALGLIGNESEFQGLANVGIALLLFIIGLGMNVGTIKRVGSPVAVSTIGLLAVVGGVGYGLGLWLGFSQLASIVIGLCLFFSSTIIIVKVLNDKHEQTRLHGQIAIGINLLEDIIATLALLFVSASGNAESSFGWSQLSGLLVNGAALLALLIISSKFILKPLVKHIASSQESLFLFAIAWGFGIASLFEFAGLSIEVGALFAGVSLASLPYAQEIESRLKPLRDFFVVLFFIVLGSSLTVKNLGAVLVPSLILSAAVIVLKPVIVTISLGLLGYTKRVSLKAGLVLSQISEFSVVLVVLAVSQGVASAKVGSLITLVTIITITISTYLIKYDEELFRGFDRVKLFYGLFDRARLKERQQIDNYEVMLIGYQRGGHEFIRTFHKMQKKFIVVDYNPASVELLTERHIPCLFGDATDSELLQEVGVANMSLIVSTMTSFSANKILIQHLNIYNPDALMVCNAGSYEEALQLYELGASYVMIPHYAGSERLGHLIQKNGIDRKQFDHYRARHLQHLQASHPLDPAEDAV